jgi:hypothetical protein
MQKTLFIIKMKLNLYISPSSSHLMRVFAVCVCVEGVIDFFSLRCEEERLFLEKMRIENQKLVLREN